MFACNVTVAKDIVVTNAGNKPVRLPGRQFRGDIAIQSKGKSKLRSGQAEGVDADRRVRGSRSQKPSIPKSMATGRMSIKLHH